MYTSFFLYSSLKIVIRVYHPVIEVSNGEDIGNLRRFRDHWLKVQSDTLDRIESIRNDPWASGVFNVLLPGRIYPTPEGNYYLHNVLPLTTFRGQVCYEWGLQPSIERSKTKYPPDYPKELRDLLCEMRIQEFRKMIEGTNRVRRWHSYDVPYPEGYRIRNGLLFDYRSVAQHYQIPTEIIDFTNNIDVALFFACTRYDETDGRYHPVDEEWIEEHEYGAIFSSIPLFETTDHVPVDNEGSMFIPVQPFGRPYLQSGYAMRPSGHVDIVTKFRFRHDADFSRRIFDRFHGGKDIFPSEGLDWLVEEVDHIMGSRSFSDQSFENSCSHLGISREKSEKMVDLLEGYGYSIGRNAYSRSDWEIASYESDWTVEGYLRDIGIGVPEHTITISMEDSEVLTLMDLKPKMQYIAGLYTMIYGIL